MLGLPGQGCACSGRGLRVTRGLKRGRAAGGSSARLIHVLYILASAPDPAQRIEMDYEWRTVYTVVTSQDMFLVVVLYILF